MTSYELRLAAYAGPPPGQKPSVVAFARVHACDLICRSTELSR